MVSFAVQKQLFSLVCSPLVFGVKSSKPKIDVKELTVSKCLVLGLTFSSLTQFELIFVCGII